MKSQQTVRNIRIEGSNKSGDRRHLFDHRLRRRLGDRVLEAPDIGDLASHVEVNEPEAINHVMTLELIEGSEDLMHEETELRLLEPRERSGARVGGERLCVFR